MHAYNPVAWRDAIVAAKAYVPPGKQEVVSVWCRYDSSLVAVAVVSQDSETFKLTIMRASDDAGLFALPCAFATELECLHADRTLADVCGCEVIRIRWHGAAQEGELSWAEFNTLVRDWSTAQRLYAAAMRTITAHKH